MKMLTILCCVAIIPTVLCAPYTYTTKYIDVPIDHFNFANNATFKLRYLVNDTYYVKDGPIFFYTGNEGQIETFAQNTGFINDIAPKFNALIVFAEHRYYGESLPFGNQSYTNLKNLGYLSSSQALADFVYLITELKQQYKSQELSSVPVIAFGGSYGGMLSAWIRIKYPAMVEGAIASSAPIWQFTDLTPCKLFYRIVTNVYETFGTEKCADTIKKSWALLRAQGKSDAGKAWLTEEFKLCSPLKTDANISALADWISGIYVNLAMVNYPYPTGFLAQLPAYPVREVCDNINSINITSDRDHLKAISMGLSVYTNFTKSKKCNSLGGTSANLGEKGWGFQSCTEMVMPMCSTDDDMFENLKWDFKQYQEDCTKSYFGVKPLNPYLPIMEYGGKDLEAASNIVFSNGLMDPWSSGGVLSNVSSKIFSVILPDGAHHYDLRSANPDDTDTVKDVRNFHVKAIKSWLKNFYKAHTLANVNDFSKF
ncbi:unnamed protein product [Brassicogethes aeneus]|uniref:Lysosomal Pro-X carboxypeptidase n=1 Tax=Brassicogethes aeneus TaxID=1431903 RepID=A0A9P0BE89_BRAAE|nr:unnamed protein product [Brassicogethes aeneus]